MYEEDRGKLSNDHGPSSRLLPIIELILHNGRYRIIKRGYPCIILLNRACQPDEIEISFERRDSLAIIKTTFRCNNFPIIACYEEKYDV